MKNEENTMKTGIVFEGGAFRTVFSCGVMDAFIKKNIYPDYCIGTSQAQPMEFHIFQNNTEETLIFF